MPAGRDRPARRRAFPGPHGPVRSQSHGGVPPPAHRGVRAPVRRTWSRPTSAPEPPSSWPSGTRTRSRALSPAAALRRTRWTSRARSPHRRSRCSRTSTSALPNGATVEPVAPRALEPDVWEDCPTSYENGALPSPPGTCEGTPSNSPYCVTCCPGAGPGAHRHRHDALVPVSNGRYLAKRIPGSQLSVLGADHFAWKQVPGQYAAIVAD